MKIIQILLTTVLLLIVFESKAQKVNLFSTNKEAVVLNLENIQRDLGSSKQFMFYSPSSKEAVVLNIEELPIPNRNKESMTLNGFTLYTKKSQVVIDNNDKLEGEKYK